jgi:signal transduction histidine kinase
MLGLFVVSQKINKETRLTFFFYSTSLSLWSAGQGCAIYNDNYWISLLAVKVCHVGVVLIPVFFTHLILVILGISNLKRKFLASIYSIAALLLLFIPTKLLIQTVSLYSPHFKYIFVPGPLYFPMLGFWLFLVIYAFIFLLKGYLTSIGPKRHQLKYFFAGLLISYLGGAPNFLLGFRIEIPIAMPFGTYALPLYVGITAYTILKYKFLNIDIIIRRTVVFAGLLAFVFGVFSAATFFVQEVLSRFLGASNLWTYGISLFLIVLGYDPIRNFLIELTDKHLFQKKYDYQKLLKDASRGMSKIENLQHLLALVIHFITMKMRIRNAAVLTRQNASQEFTLQYQRGYEKNFLEYRIDDTNPLIIYLRKEKEAIDLERVREYIEAGNKKKVKGDKPHEYDFDAIRCTMEELQAASCVPSFLGQELRNILLLGEKKSGDYYTQEDLNVLFTLAQESAIAIENARLYDEAVAKSSQLSKINEQLEYSKNLLIKSLRETEIANKQLQDTQAQLIHEQKMATLGRLAASVGHEVNNPLTILSMNVSRAILKYRKNPDLRVGEILELFQKMEQNIGRIKAVVNTLTGLLKRSEKGKFEPLSLKLILEETLPLVQFQTYLDNLTGTEVDFDIPGSTPLIRGDLERLQEVFLNLFINAYHAMQGRRNRRIRVTAEPDTENPQQVAIHFTDNGSGMTEEVMKKIFNYGFTTKPPGKGSGMGLYMCKYIIELHGGDIKVRSKIGEGTTFTIYLPSYEENTGEATNYRVEASS